jgi:hypothetical protein
MVTKHLIDDELQQYVIDKHRCERRIAEHINFCEECRTKAEFYQLMIAGIRQQPQPVFDFNLSDRVLQQLPLPEEKANDSLLLSVLIVIGCVFMGTAIYYFEGSLVYLFRGVAAIFIYLIIISALTVFGWVFIDMYKKYNKEMKLLDSY